MKPPAIFLDRDGTLVETRHFPSTPDELRLFDGLASDLAGVQRFGYRLVVITNQSGIARGLFSPAALEIMHDYLRQQLLQSGAVLDAIYHCPHHPEGIVPELSITCDCRKPAPGMLLRATQELDIDLARSWFIGDILDDVEAGNRAECRTILVDLGTESEPEEEIRRPTFVARDSRHAIAIVRAVDGFGDQTDLHYRPATWNLRENAA
jgi:D-glycero-D-manno-heptose 1,7-bisphosphate phosphatase